MGRGWTGAIVVALLASLAPIASAPTATAATPIARTWGENNEGELGNGVVSGSGGARPLQHAVRNTANTADFGSAAAMDGGNDHAVWLKADGTVHAAGDDSLGQLGSSGGVADSSTPVQVASLSNVLQADAGANHTVALVSDGSGDGNDSDGTVWGWGHNFNGQIGVVGGGNNSSEVPVAIAGAPADVIDVSGAVGGGHTLAVATDTTVWAWGAGSSGQLGTTTACPCSDSNVPTQVLDTDGVGNLTGIIDVDAGTGHSVARASDGSVYVWGAGGVGQIGDGTANNTYPLPVKVRGVNSVGFLSQVDEIAAGNAHTIARIGSNVVGWGNNTDGQIGNNGSGSQLTPAEVLAPGGVGAISGIDDIAAGNVHSMAAGNGFVYVWGANSQFGCQAGQGSCDSTDFPAPVRPKQIFGATAVGAGGFFSLAVADADTTAPTGTVEINSGDAATNDDDVQLSLTFDDGTGTGVESMRFSNDGTTFSAWQSATDTVVWQLTSGDGTKTVRAQFQDAVGNISTSFTDDITVDTTPPTATIEINESADYASSTTVELDLTGDDGSGSGVDQMSFSEDGTTFGSAESFNTSKQYVFADTSDGPKTIVVKVTDAAGNFGTATDTVILDTTNPTVASFSPAGKKIGRTKNIVVTFSEEMATTSMTQATVTLKKGTRTIDTTLTFGDPTTLTIDPVKRLKSGAKYTVTLTIGVTDKAGIGLLAPVTKSYRVK